ncbi:EamA family transporter [Sporomusa aerivorans]|uniref:EamA family transporter n=1 Tax=Sporomusa aerivorans TaxID=204936 RepID=UPI00352AB2C8
MNFSIILALLAVYFAWGGTYLAMRFAVETLPPFLLAGIRFTLAGMLLYFWEFARGTKNPEKTHWRNAGIIGGLMLLGGNSLVVWAEQTIPSGIAALIVATVPLWITIFAWIWQGGAKPNRYVIAGLGLGFVGQVLLVCNSWQSTTYQPEQFSGYIILTFSALFWAAGSVYSRQAELPSSSLMSIAIQNLTGGILCLLVGIFAGELSQLNLGNISARSLYSLAYLIFIGSLIGFSAYIWVLKKAEPAIVSTYAYVNPIVAVFLGWYFANENLTINDGLAAISIVAAIILITKSQRKVTQLKQSYSFSGLDGDGI